MHYLTLCRFKIILENVPYSLNKVKQRGSIETNKIILKPKFPIFLLELTVSSKERVQVLRQPTHTCLKFLAPAINNIHSSSRNLGGTHGKCRSQVIDLVLPLATGAGQVWGHLVQRRQGWPRVWIINQINCYDFSLNRVVINQCRSIYGHSLELLLVWLGPPLNEELTTHWWSPERLLATLEQNSTHCWNVLLTHRPKTHKVRKGPRTAVVMSPPTGCNYYHYWFGIVK